MSKIDSKQIAYYGKPIDSSDVRTSFTTGQLRICDLNRVKQRQSGKFRFEK